MSKKTAIRSSYYFPQFYRYRKCKYILLKATKLKLYIVSLGCKVGYCKQVDTLSPSRRAKI